MLGNEDLFENIYDENGRYSAKMHLAEMISILGPIPDSVIKREKEMNHWRWSPEIRALDGQMCNSAAGYFGGPFIDESGEAR